jgi:L-ascorbate metabolism protein UlaG (beta-lactamase superfamily)
MSWRGITDALKHSRWVLKLADRLGRGRGAFRYLDHLHALPRPPHRPELSGWSRHELAAAWIGHATALLRMGGMNILTDPVFSSRVGVGLGLATGGPRRYQAPAVALSRLPALDLILISHAHFDHLDRPTLNRLPKNVPVITSEHNSDLIADLGFASVRELRWGESCAVGPLKVTAQKIRHWGARTFHDDHRGFAAFVLEAGRRRVLFGADTAYCDYFREVGPVDLAMLGIAGYDPYIASHATPEQAWEMAGHLGADAVMAMHHSTFRLSFEPMDEPIERLLRAAGSDAGRVVIREVGQTWTL